MRRALLALVLAGCSTRPGYYTNTYGDGTPEVEDKIYQEALNRYTVWKSDYDELDNRVFASATWQSWPFRKERIRATADFLSLAPGKAGEMLTAEAAEARTYTDIFLGMYTAQRRWNELETPRSIWRIELSDGVHPGVTPVAIERFEKPDANIRALYPYVNVFWVGYHLRFPPLVTDQKLQLLLSSAVGKVRFTWDSRGVEGPPPAPAPPPRPTP